MGQKSRSSGNGVSAGSLEKRKKDKTALVLDGLVSDLAHRSQAAIDGSGPVQHLESIRGIHRLLGQIEKLERPFAQQSKVPDTAARLEDLGNWLQLQNVPIEGLKLQGGLREGVGIVAQQAFEKAQLLCTVPADVMMTTATAIRSKDDVGLLFNADRMILQQMPALTLALHLLFEKHRLAEDPSRWAPYIASLPGQGPPSGTNEDFVMPLGFSLETIEALKGTAVLVEMHKIIRNHARQYAHVRLLLKQLRGKSSAIERANFWFTWAEFRWASSIVMTRQNPIPRTSDMEVGQALALIPFLDMFNHEEGAITCHFVVEHQQMELTAKRSFRAGEQVYISYGNRPNYALMLYSGFVPDNNSKDRMKVPVELPASDPLYARKVGLLKWLEIPSSGWLELFHDGTPSLELAAWIKVAIMQDSSIVTESLRAAIASRAQETAAILQYKSAICKSEEMNNISLQLGNDANTENGVTLMKDDYLQGQAASRRLLAMLANKSSSAAHHCSREVTVSNGVTDDKSIQNNIKDTDPQNAQEVDFPAQVSTEGLQEANGKVDSVLVLVTETGSGQLASGGGDVSETGLINHDSTSDHNLGEHLLSSEAALLGDICKMRLRELGAENEVFSNVPTGTSLGVRADVKSVQLQDLPNSLSMALKIRWQEQGTLLRAIGRGKKRNVNLKNCHCHSEELAHILPA